MQKPRFSCALVFGAALGGLGISTGKSALSVDLRAATRNGVAVPDPKSLAVAVGDTIIFRVFADVTGLNDAKPDCLQDLSGSFLSTGGIKGNLALTLAGLTSPFNAQPSAAGQQTDLDGDGDLDLGSNNSAEAQNLFFVRSDRMTGPRSTWPDGTSVFPPGAGPTAIPNGTEYRIVSTLRMFITDLGSPTVVNFRKSISSAGGFWAQDATEVATDNGDGTTMYTYQGGTGFTDTSNVVAHGVTLVVPEPAELGVASLSALGLLALRRVGFHRLRTFRCWAHDPPAAGSSS